MLERKVTVVHNTTLQLNSVRKDHKAFAWGNIRNLFEFGPYTVAEYVPYSEHNGHPMYFGWITDTADTEPVPVYSAWDSLDAAIIGLMARKNNRQHMEDAVYVLMNVGTTEPMLYGKNVQYKKANV